jgi:SAM-dependent methyltransferase
MFDASYFDEDYFERGRQTGKSLYENYRWQPRRSYREALAIIDAMGITNGSALLDVGCAKGFLVRALRDLGVDAEGCDVSEYALVHADEAARRWLWRPTEAEWLERTCRYQHAFAKDVLEHCDVDEAERLLRDVLRCAGRLMAVVPRGDAGRYRIAEYHGDPSHVLVLNEVEWEAMFAAAGWRVQRFSHHEPGIKDNWFRLEPAGNAVFLLERDE